MNYFPTIGLEIHAELNTRTKMFCGCLNDPQEKQPNVNICPVCMAHPGTLPVINKEAVRKVLLVGTALGGTLPDRAWFDRKNYFYPDIPKGYQISQYKDPLVSGGSLAGVDITRVHLEEDTARSQHPSIPLPFKGLSGPSGQSNGGTGEENRSLVDFNRAGVPLMELVTEPVIHEAGVAGRFARELQLLLRYLSASEANMEQGQMRVEANVSVSNRQQTTNNKQLGTKVEVKNLNSFRSVERAIAYEIERQTALLESGGKVVQETRGWDENKQVTFNQRLKESSHDYRYFPEPDLPQLKLSEIPEFSAERLKMSLPELPEARRRRLRSAFGLSDESVEVFVNNAVLREFFELVARALERDAEAIRLGSNYIVSDISGLIATYPDVPWLQNITREYFTELIKMIVNNKISSRAAKDILAILFAKGGDPKIIAEEKGLIQQSDTGVLETIAKKVIDAHSSVVADYRAGKAASLQFFIGQAMKESRGSANPQELRRIFEQLLSNT